MQQTKFQQGQRLNRTLNGQRKDIAASRRHAAPWNVPLLLSLTLLALPFSRASATQTLPIKHMNEANKQIHWPGDIDPSKQRDFCQGPRKRDLGEPGQCHRLAELVLEFG